MDTALERYISPDHCRDEHCIVDPATDCCIVCHTLHGESCEYCGAHAFHLGTCPTQAIPVPAQDDNIGGYPPFPGPGFLMYIAIGLAGIAWLGDILRHFITQR
jgi:hypothetical protein